MSQPRRLPIQLIARNVIAELEKDGVLQRELLAVPEGVRSEASLTRDLRAAISNWGVPLPAEGESPHPLLAAIRNVMDAASALLGGAIVAEFEKLFADQRTKFAIVEASWEVVERGPGELTLENVNAFMPSRTRWLDVWAPGLLVVPLDASKLTTLNRDRYRPGSIVTLELFAKIQRLQDAQAVDATASRELVLTPIVAFSP